MSQFDCHGFFFLDTGQKSCFDLIPTSRNQARLWFLSEADVTFHITNQTIEPLWEIYLGLNVAGNDSTQFITKSWLIFFRHFIAGMLNNISLSLKPVSSRVVFQFILVVNDNNPTSLQLIKY